ncbi:MAG: T9SS type A sorting domain-containing protein [Fibrobacteres bacterium]|nr:T9SS type A sorting domain-containing protein [Fibrobacterota bacterium]
MRYSIVALTLLIMASFSNADIIPPDVHFITHTLKFTNYNEFSDKIIFHTYRSGYYGIPYCDTVKNGILNNFSGEISISNFGSCQCSSGYLIPYNVASGLNVGASEFLRVSNTDPRISIISEYIFYYDSTVKLRAAIQKKTVKFSNGKADSVITYPKPSAIEKNTVLQNSKQATVKYANGYINYSLPSNAPATLTFWDPTGKRVSFLKITSTSGKVLVPSLPSGNYLAVLEGQNVKVSTKLVIKH